jgi:hypothetical protein
MQWDMALVVGAGYTTVRLASSVGWRGAKRGGVVVQLTICLFVDCGRAVDGWRNDGDMAWRVKMSSVFGSSHGGF